MEQFRKARTFYRRKVRLPVHNYLQDPDRYSLFVLLLLAPIWNAFLRVLALCQLLITTVTSRLVPSSSCTHADESPFRFLDLPPEIRNMIYAELLNMENNWIAADWRRYISQPRFQSRTVDANRKLHQYSRGLFPPYSHWWKLRNEKWAKESDWEDPEKVVSGTILHAEPVIWQVNRRIRREARYLYITKHLVVETRGGANEFVLDKDLKLKSLDLWLSLMDEDLLKKAHRVVLRQFATVHFVDPDPRWKHEGVSMKGRGPLPWRIAVEIPFCITLSPTRRGLTIETPVEIYDTLMRITQAHLESLASQKARQKALFDGRDIFALIRWIATAPELELPHRGPEPAGASIAKVEAVYMPWVATAKNDELWFRKGLERPIILPEFRYVLGRCVIGHRQGLSGNEASTGVTRGEKSER